MILPVILLGGCATLLNPDDVMISVTTRPAGAAVYIDEESTPRTTPTTIRRQRSTRSVALTFIHDSTRRRIVLPAKHSVNYLLTNLIFWPGYFIDLGSNRRFTYDEEIYVDLLDSAGDYSIWDTFTEPATFHGMVALSFYGMPMPEVTWHHFDDGERHVEKGGINSINAILQYVSRRGSIYVLTADARSTIIGECPGGGCISTDHGALSVALLKGWESPWAWLASGAHVTFSQTRVAEEIGGLPFVTITRAAEIGPALNGALRLGESAWLVLAYQPSLFEIDRRKFIYTHQASLALRFLWGP